MRLKGKVALVTGSSRGIGRAIALAFAEEGADLIINYIRSANMAREVVSKINSTGRKAFAIKADIPNIEEVENMTNQSIENFGHLDILVNNAADYSIMDFSLNNPDWKG